MNSLLFLSLLVCSVAFASCGEYMNNFRGVKFHFDLDKDFYQLCPDDEFKISRLLQNGRLYIGQVNSFAIHRGQLLLHEIGDYALDDSPNYYQKLFSSSDAEKLDEIRSAYHHQLIDEMFGENHYNDPSYGENVLYQKFSTFQADLAGFRRKGKTPFVDVVLDIQTNKIEEAKNLTKLVHRYKTDRTPAPTASVLKAFEQSLKVLQTKLGNNATMVLFGEKIAQVYEKGIYKFDRFEPIKSRRFIKPWKKSSAYVNFTLHLPFELHARKFVNKTRPCVPAKQLPVFYQVKGRPDY